MKDKKYNFVFVDSYSGISVVNNDVVDALYDYITVQKGSMFITANQSRSDVADLKRDVYNGSGLMANLLLKLNNNADFPNPANTATTRRGFVIPGAKYTEQKVFKISNLENSNIFANRANENEGNMNITGTNYLPMLTGAKDDITSSMMVRHKDYKFVYGGGMSRVQYQSYFGARRTYNVTTGEVFEYRYNDHSNGNKIPRFIGNVICNMIIEIMNE